VSVESKLTVNEEDYVAKFRPELMEVVFQWAKVRHTLLETVIQHGTHTHTLMHTHVYVH
jgi:septum formation topological specificity factor MinE